MIQFWPLYLLSFLLSFAICVPLCRALIPWLRRKAAQPIYEGGPAWHTAKAGTPTLGGLAFIASIGAAATVATLVLYHAGAEREALSVLTVFGFALLNSLIGLVDDLTKLAKKRNMGLSPLQKLCLQSLIALGFLFIRYRIFSDDTSISVAGFTLELGIPYYIGAFIFLLGIVNCANLTDGIDGLAASVSFAIGISLFLICATSFPDVAVISSMLSGGVLGFLLFNANPAKIFMGDTGSLFLGAVCASVVFILDDPFLSLLLGGVYVIEGCSVIIQVISYKTRKKRVFIMAPLHHHLEKKGYGEMKICYIGMIATLLLSIPVYFLV